MIIYALEDSQINLLNYFLGLFFSGIFLESKLETSSKFFKYVFSNFSKGLAALPSNGMQKIPDLIKKNINKTSVTLNRCVESIKPDRRVVLDNGDEIIAENIVITANSHELIGSKSVHSKVKNRVIEI